MIQLSPETLKALEQAVPYQSRLDELEHQKEQGLLPSWKEITKEQLKELLIDYEPSNQFLADLFGVTKGQVAYRRKKWQLTQAEISYESFMRSFSSREALQDLLLQDLKNMDTALLCRAVVHYIFRNGPVEDMHAAGKLSQQDMKTLNKFMMDRLATLITLFKEKDYVRLLLFLGDMQYYGGDWDAPELQMQELDEVFQLKVARHRRSFDKQ